MRRKYDNSYLHFTRKERNGIIVLLCIILLLILIPFFYPLIFNDKIITDDRYVGDITNLKARQADSSKRSYASFDEEYQPSSPASYKDHRTSISVELFYFDPNTISAADWKRLGVKEKTIATIQNYLSKGGKFREPRDIKKIWGLNDYLAERLLPFVRISNPAAFKDITTIEYKIEYPIKKDYQPIDINDADSGSFVRLPGIGARLSQRIINYREKLGGFYSADQVAETFGLPDSTYRKIRPSLNIGEKPVNQININTATLDELKAHPYIRYHLANSIVQYRQQHGIYGSIGDIRHIMLVNDSIYKKVSPYLAVE